MDERSRQVLAERRERQEVAARRVAHLDPDEIVCRVCGEQSASGSFKGYAHRWGPRSHEFTARKPKAGAQKREE